MLSNRMWLVSCSLLFAMSSVACAHRVRTDPSSRASAASAASHSDAAAEADVGKVLDAFHAAAASADEAAYFALFAGNGVFLGTDASERWPVAAFRAYVHPHFSVGHGWTYRPRARHITFAAAGDAAWFDELLDHEKYGVLRGTGVLVREGGAFKIAQYNLTFMVPNAVSSQVVPILRAPAASTP